MATLELDKFANSTHYPDIHPVRYGSRTCTHPPIAHIDELDAAVSAGRQLLRRGAMGNASQLFGVKLGTVLLSTLTKNKKKKIGGTTSITNTVT